MSAGQYLIALLIVFISGIALPQNVEWVARYDGGSSLLDHAEAMVIDADGNVYVTGWTHDSVCLYDYATVKYSSLGDIVWVATYDGVAVSPDEADEALGIAVDDSGNVCVTGRSRGASRRHDYLTIKYNSSGDSLWTQRYDGSSHDDDEAHAIAVDDRGCVYVTGMVEDTSGMLNYATIKYGASGDTVWVVRYDGPAGFSDYANAIALDSAGNVYVTGPSSGSGTGHDYLTIKYDSLGDTVWTARYDGPANDMDEAVDIVIDDSENVYVTGWSRGTLGNWNYATIKYDPSGDSVWVARYKGPGSDDQAEAIAIDDLGNVYVTGCSEDSMGVDDFLTIKYSPVGDILWTARYDGPEGEWDHAVDIAVDDSGNVYVTGDSDGWRSHNDYATIKYDSEGNEKWVARYEGTARSMDTPSAIAVDASGFVYVTGESYGAGTGPDFLTIKYSSSTGIEEKPGPEVREYVSLNIYPNPFRQDAVIRCSCPSQSHISLRLYDMAGRFAAHVSEGEVTAGYHSFKIHSGDLPQGVYFVYLSTGRSELVRKVVLLN